MIYERKNDTTRLTEIIRIGWGTCVLFFTDSPGECLLYKCQTFLLPLLFYFNSQGVALAVPGEGSLPYLARSSMSEGYWGYHSSTRRFVSHDSLVLEMLNTAQASEGSVNHDNQSVTQGFTFLHRM